MTRRRWVVALAGAAFLVLYVVPVALAKYRGSDMLSGMAPGGGWGGGPLMSRYPLGAYALDYHVSVGVTDPGGVPATISQWLAAQLWAVTSFVTWLVISAFSWAFSLDLLDGGAGGGVLTPVSAAVGGLYRNTIGEAWMGAAIAAAGLWAVWHGLARRKIAETVATLAVSVALAVVALMLIQQPRQLVGQASGWTNDVSVAFLAGANGDTPGDARQQVTDRLFTALVLRPWAMLEFGGLSHCVDANHPDGDGFPKPAGPGDPHTTCRNHLRRDAAGYGGYAALFLAQPAGSSGRDQVYVALRDGTAAGVSNPVVCTVQQAAGGACTDPIPPGQKIDKADAPAVDVQQAGGAFERLVAAILILLGNLGAVLLLGFLALAVILAQIVAMVLLGFAPVMLLAAIIPGRGHDLFRKWAGKLATALFVKAVYALVLAVAIAVGMALGAATGSLGWLFAYGLQAIYYWSLFLFRKQLTTAATGRAEHHGLMKSAAGAWAVETALHPVSAVRKAGSKGSKGDKGEDGGQESVLVERREDGLAAPEGGSAEAGRAPVDSVSPPASAGRAYSPPGPAPEKREDGLPRGGPMMYDQPARPVPAPSAAGQPHEPAPANGPEPVRPEPVVKWEPPVAANGHLPAPEPAEKPVDTPDRVDVQP